ncbi:MAG: diacylglycerol kinase family protein [Pyrinomonadaceae bacterium]
MAVPLVIVNPESASGATRKAWPSIASDLRSTFGPFQIAFTDAPGSASELATQGARKGVTLIIACGGDGTISEVANGILAAGVDVELGILPSGTGGDFRRTLAIPTSARAAGKVLRDGRSRRIDVGRVTFLNERGLETVRFFVGVASLGMSTRIIQRVKENTPGWLPASSPGWLRSRAAFGSSMVKTALRAEACRVVVQLDDAPERHLALANLCIANARYFGGGMKIAPDARLADGRFDVVSIGDLSTLQIMRKAPRLYFGAHMSMAEVSHTLAQKASVRAADASLNIDLEIDGELPGRLPATFQIVPDALRVRCNG